MNKKFLTSFFTAIILQDMKIKIIVVGKTREKYLQIGEKDFSGRLSNYCQFERIVVKEEKIQASKNEVTIKEQEGKRILDKVANTALMVALDQRGEQLSSEKLAGFIQNEMNKGTKEIDFVIGGALGLGENVMAKASKKMSLSEMTFTHEMVRLILLEQLYRAFAILAGSKYHK